MFEVGCTIYFTRRDPHDQRLEIEQHLKRNQSKINETIFGYPTHIASLFRLFRSCISCSDQKHARRTRWPVRGIVNEMPRFLVCFACDCLYCMLLYIVPSCALGLRLMSKESEENSPAARSRLRSRRSDQKGGGNEGDERKTSTAGIA